MNSRSGRPSLRVGLVQFRPRKGRVGENLSRVREIVEQSVDRLDLLVFPEASLSGYFLEGGVSEAALSLDDLVSRLGVPASGAPDVVVGFYEKWRRRPYNSVAYLQATPLLADEAGGNAPPEASPAAPPSRFTPLHVHRKMFLPTYGVFDEARFVEAGTTVEAFQTRFGRVGTLICEEMWHALPATALALGGAELLVVVSASPARDFSPEGEGRPGNLSRWERMVRVTAEEHGVFVVVAQLVGSEGGKIFPGGSLAVAPDGSVLAEGPLLEEAIVEVALDGRQIDRARSEAPLLSDLQERLPHLLQSLEQAGSRAGRGGRSQLEAGIEGAEGNEGNEGNEGAEGMETTGEEGPSQDTSVLEIDAPLVQRTLVHFIRDEVFEKRGFEKVVVGVSGGVDSAVSLTLAVEALGPENVLGLRLPYATSSPDSLEDAQLVLEATGAEARTIEITDPIDAYVERYEPEISPLRKGNLMARLRGVILFDQAARLGALPLGTGNKSERLMGYFTWHADDSPPINPLGDLFKTQVWALARHLGVPDAIVEKPASADLVRGVHDEDELGIGYHRADPILHWLTRGYRPEELVERGFDPSEVELVTRRLDSTHWKRELPTVAVLSSSAIGEFYLRPVDY